MCNGPRSLPQPSEFSRYRFLMSQWTHTHMHTHMHTHTHTHTHMRVHTHTTTHTHARTHTHTLHTVQQPHIEGFTQERPAMSWPLNPNKAPPSPSTMHPQTHLLLPQAGESPQRDQPGRVWCHGPSPPESSDPAPARSARSLQTPQLGASDRVGAKKLCTLQAMSTWALATPNKN